MIGRFIGGLTLARASWQILRADKELLVFPVVSFLLATLVSIGFFIPVWASGTLTDVGRGSYPVALLIDLFLYYLAMYTLITYCNVAIVGAAIIRLDGGDPTLRDGFSAANSRVPQILGYALICATVGVLIRAIADRSGLIGRVVAGGLGVAWSLATFLAVPVLVVEDVGPVEAIRRSSGLLRDTWGEQVGGTLGIGLVFGVIGTVVVVGGVAVLSLVADTGPYAIAAVVVALAFLMAALGAVSTTLSGILTASVYRYATTGGGGSLFPPATLDAAFRPRD